MDAYSARISGSAPIAEGVSYQELLDRIHEFTLRGAFARAFDQQIWEHDELRRNGLRALEIFHNARAVWQDEVEFAASLAEERFRGAGDPFESGNELDPGLLSRIDRDLRERWRIAGYQVPSLLDDMRRLFEELEADARDCALEAREAFIAEVLAGQPRL